ncbi:uncharacterized protein LOC127725859 [Mytilus californianus]|uniref:uncharacterized protein LOC127725859 n=1 Tax=Mytilus californianus TaxID=6549 RepID=UPI00224594C5|nr:uncharacterized protein LOC127725859 [Mytilus californianus]XP_052089153.1 uncharacterized protein LOC127725859 [Mytilus californianus]XP_052089154.1 uncharacterized protein LOC127725859 [Mytilus californianus]
MPSSLNRSRLRQTCPITRKESEQLLEFFLHLPSSPTEKEKPTNDNFVYTVEKQDSSCVQDRPEFKRSDSYRKATQRFSLEDVVETMTFKKEDYDHKKYKSLPVDRTKITHTDNKSKLLVGRKNKLNRQKSGTVPSSDSDNNTSPPENRKKKSVVQRTKERIIFILWKDKKHGDKKKSKESKRTPTLHHGNHGNEIVLRVNDNKGQILTTSNDAEIIERKTNNNSIKSRTLEYTKGSPSNQQSPAQNMAPTSKSPARDRRYRSQVSREEITNMFEKCLSSAEVTDEPYKFPAQRVHKRKDFSPVRDISYADGIKNKKSGLKLNLDPFTPDFKVESHTTVIQESRTIVSDGTRQTLLTDRRTIERTFSLEVDGGNDDEVDGPMGSPLKEVVRLQTGDEPQEPLSASEQEKMIEEIARRLTRIAEDCVQRMGAGGTSPIQGATAGPLLSPASQGRKLAKDLVDELRKEGDRLSREMNLPANLLPIVMDMVKQITYDHFKDLVKRALCETIGWDQVALYFYISKAAIVMAGAGGSIACKLKDMAVRYFHEELLPWIYDRGGLETMLEETDSEVD